MLLDVSILNVYCHRIFGLCNIDKNQNNDNNIKLKASDPLFPEICFRYKRFLKIMKVTM